MRLLAIDTTGPACAAALRLPGQPDRIDKESMARGQAERLAPMVSGLLDEAGIAPRDLDRIGVATGPGSFAGSRIGVAFARGLALATGAECTGISNLAWWAREADPSGSRTLLAVHDARRGEVVCQLFQKGEPAEPPAIRSVAELTDWLADHRQPGGLADELTAVGTGTPLTGKRTIHPKTEFDLRILLDLTGQAAAPFDPPKPFYARPPDAKLPGGRDA